MSGVTECLYVTSQEGASVLRGRGAFAPHRHRGLRVVEAGGAPVHAALPVRPQQPGGDQDVLSRYSLTGIFSEETLDQTFSSRTEIIGKVELAPPDLGEQAAVFRAVERISAMKGMVIKILSHDFICVFHVPSNQHGVQHHAEAPHVRRPARVLRVGPQDLRGHVGGAAVLVRQQVIRVILQHNRVLE